MSPPGGWISTDLPAVVNFELPRSAEVYVHRIGRTGRAGKGGLALSLFTDAERYRLDSIGEFQQREPPFEAMEAISWSHAVACRHRRL